MAIILFGGEKGGTGKSTLATNYAVALARGGRDVLLVDTDRQGSADGWASLRGADSADLPRVHCIQKFQDVAGVIQDLVRRYDEIVIDAGGRDSRELRSAMVVANAMYIPVKASQFDLWTMDRLDQLVDTSRGFNPALKAWVVLSMAPTHPGIREAEGARGLLSQFENVQLARSVVCERKAYREATATGRGVLELSNPKAAAEIETLAEEVRCGV